MKRFAFGFTVAVALVLPLATPSVARAQDGFATIPILLDQLAQSIKNGLQIREMVAKATDTLHTVREYAGYVKDARAAYQEIASLTPEGFQEQLRRSFERAFPEVAMFEYEVTAIASWSGATGALPRDAADCLRRVIERAQREGRAAGTGRSEFPARIARELPRVECFETLRREQVAEALRDTFGAIPPGTDYSDALAATDEAVVRAVGKSDEKAKKAMADRVTYLKLQAICRSARDPAACEAAADLASVEQVAQLADLNDQLSELLRLQAVALAADNAQRKQRVNDFVRQRELVLEGLAASPAPIGLVFPGAHLVEGEG